MTSSNCFSITEATSALALAASGLSAGQTAEFDSGWNNQLRLGATGDIQWCTSLIFHDPVRKECQMMGKPAGGQSHLFSHDIYDELTNTWRRTNLEDLRDGGSNSGHMWGQCYDWHTGNYWFFHQDKKKVFFYNYSTDLFDSTPEYANIMSPSGTQSTGGLAYHPNLFGEGDGGILINDTNYINAWRKSNSTWYSIDGPKGSGHPAFGPRGGGDSAYISSTDSVVFGTGHIGSSVSGPLVRVGAGSGGSPGTVEYLTAAYPPDQVRSIGGSSTAGRVVLDPTNPARLLYLEVSDTGEAVFESLDGGTSWQNAGFAHPFRTGLTKPSGTDTYHMWTCGTLPEYEVIWGMTGVSSGTRSLLWRPG
jgi:hypothetical protein